MYGYVKLFGNYISKNLFENYVKIAELRVRGWKKAVKGFPWISLSGLHSMAATERSLQDVRLKSIAAHREMQLCIEYNFMLSAKTTITQRAMALQKYSLSCHHTPFQRGKVWMCGIT